MTFELCLEHRKYFINIGYNENLFSSGLPKYCIWILEDWVSLGYFSLSFSPSAVIMIITALQSVRTKASEWYESSEKVELCLMGVCSWRVCLPSSFLPWCDCAHHYPEDVCVWGKLYIIMGTCCIASENLSIGPLGLVFSLLSLWL